MNKNLRIITINGIRGIIMVLFIIFGLISGFIISPAWVCMKLWNIYVSANISVAEMNLYQGLMLWAIIALSLYALNNKHSLIGFGSYKQLSNEQIKEIIKKSKMSNDFRLIKDLEALQNAMKTKKDIKSDLNVPENNSENKNCMNKNDEKNEIEKISRCDSENCKSELNINNNFKQELKENTEEIRG